MGSVCPVLGLGCHLAGSEARPSLEVALQFQKDSHSFSMY